MRLLQPSVVCKRQHVHVYILYILYMYMPVTPVQLMRPGIGLRAVGDLGSCGSQLNFIHDIVHSVVCCSVLCHRGELGEGGDVSHGLFIIRKSSVRKVAFE